MIPPNPPSVPAAERRPSSPAEVFVAFTLLALQGFGGVIVVAQRVLCEQRRWLTREEFLELLSVGQVVPGPNICNVALMLGDRLFGTRGAIAALGGLVAVPLALVLGLTAMYAHWATHQAVAGAVHGMGAVSAGLIAGTAVKLASALRRTALGIPVAAGVAAVAFALVALLRVPLPWALAATGTASWLLALRAHRRAGEAP